MFNRPKTVPYFTHSLVLCKNRLLTHCVIVSLQIIFFKISQQIAKHIPRDCRFLCKRRFGDQDWATKLNWQTFYPVPRQFKTSRRFAVRFSSIPITFNWIAVKFVFLNCIFTTMNHLKTGKNREEVKCEESLIYCVDVLANYPLWSFIPQTTTDYNFIPKYPFMTSFPSLVEARFLL